MATAQVVSATTALYDEKIDEQPMKEPQEDIKNIDETVKLSDQNPKEPAADITVAPEPELAAPELEPHPEAEPEALVAEVETKLMLKEEKEEGKINPVDQTAKVAPEPCVEEKEKTETEPTEVAKIEPEPEPEEEPEGGAAEE